jgi:hypothetical protein
MYKNRIRGVSAGRAGVRSQSPYPSRAQNVNSGGCAPKTVELTSGDLSFGPGIGTEGGVIHPDRAAEVSRGRISPARDEGPNGLDREVEVKEVASTR